jgi:hypothetical protein
MNMKDLPKHPLERKMQCPICNTDFASIPVRRSPSPSELTEVLEQHCCPDGHVYVTEIGKNEMLADY